jgi:hypothetical protein
VIHLGLRPQKWTVFGPLAAVVHRRRGEKFALRLAHHAGDDAGTEQLVLRQLVARPFETAEYKANADVLGTLRLLEAIRILRLE